MDYVPIIDMVEIGVYLKNHGIDRSLVRMRMRLCIKMLLSI